MLGFKIPGMISAKDLVHHWEKTANPGLQTLLAASSVPASMYLSGQLAKRTARDDYPKTLTQATAIGATSGLLGSTTGLLTGILGTKNLNHLGRNALLGAGLGALGSAGVAALGGRQAMTQKEEEEMVAGIINKLKRAGVSLAGYITDEDEMNRRLNSIPFSSVERVVLSENIGKILEAIEH